MGVVGGIVFGFQNCSSSFMALDEGSGELSNVTGGVFSAEDFRMAKDTEFTQEQQSCPEPEYSNFRCLNKILRTQEGLDYKVTFRWNRVDKESTGTVIWVLGNNGRGKWRSDFKESIAIQDDYDRSKNIRSVEIEFPEAPKISENDGGYWTHGGGYYSAAQAYMAAVAYVAANLKSGAFMNHVGGSNGTMVAAYALSHFGAGQYVNRFIFHAGPFLPDLQEACDRNHFAAFAKSSTEQMTRGFLGIWAYLNPNKDVCADKSAATINRLSLLKSIGGHAVKSYPRNAIHVVMGEKEKTEGFGEWILESNLSWYSQIQAGEKTRDVYPHLGHEMHWVSIANYAFRAPPTEMGGAPVLTFSTTRNGPTVTSPVTLSSRVYGVIKNVNVSSTAGCMVEVGRLVECENPHNWVVFPNADWSYDGSVWRSEFTPGQLGLTPGKTYAGFNINTKTGQRSPTVHLTVVADPPVPQPPIAQQLAPTLIFSKNYNGVSGPKFKVGEVIYGLAKNLPREGVKACMQEASRFHLCNDPNNWQSLPNGDWNYVNGEWRAQFLAGQFGEVGKTYVGFQVNTVTGARTPNTSITIEGSAAANSEIIAEGLFMLGVGIYYSNGSAYCQFGSMESFTKATGRTNADGIRRVTGIPSSMKSDGDCEVP